MGAIFWRNGRRYMGRYRGHTSPGLPWCKYDGILGPEHDVQQQVYDSIHFADQLLGESLGSGPSTKEFDGEVESMKELEEFYQQVSVPVWRVNDSHNSISIISAVIVIMTMCTIHGVSNAFTDELLKYLSTTLLPRSNSLPNSFYHTKTQYGRWNCSTMWFIAALLVTFFLEGSLKNRMLVLIGDAVCPDGCLDLRPYRG
jgi:hypothetical protein